MKNKTVIIAIVVIVLIVCIGGGYFLFAQKASTKQASSAPQQQQDEVVPTLSADDLGLKMALSTSGKQAGNSVNVTIGKVNDISAIDYELSYNADNPSDPTTKVPRGAIGHFDIKSSDTSVKQEIVLGTCSDVCHYDKNVTDIKVILKITKKDGKNYQTTATLQQ